MAPRGPANCAAEALLTAGPHTGFAFVSLVTLFTYPENAFGDDLSGQRCAILVSTLAIQGWLGHRSITRRDGVQNCTDSVAHTGGGY